MIDPNIRPVRAVVALAALWCSAGLIGQNRSRVGASVPRTWDDDAIARLEVPLANPAGAPKHVSANYYYKIPVRAIYRQYPVYAPDREPAGYMDWLSRQEPAIVWNDSSIAPPLNSESDWIKAGETVLDAPIIYSTENRGGFRVEDVRSRAWFAASKMPLARDGTLPFMHYVVREKGKVELGSFSCGMCHTRIMPGGNIVKGAQGNFPFGEALAQSAAVPWVAWQKLFAMPGNSPILWIV